MRRRGYILLGVGLLIGGCGSPQVPTGVTGGSYTPEDCQNKPDAIFDPTRAADKLVVDKSEHKMYVYKDGKVIKTFRVSLGSRPGKKIQQGDLKTPEGTYKILDKRCHPVKYRAMTISYPNAEDRARAKKLGVNPGSLITIHGQPHWNADGHGDEYTLAHDWTNGCIALTNKDLDWLWGSVRVGTPITIHE
ncbi:MAG: L,D-transpeptidase [Epsilonproteobacteria bacterium]|nr:L,D-transpeptidase [Campylobacterota bacterium]